MKRVYLVQAGDLFGEGKYKSAYIPYAIGALAAFAWNDSKIRAEYALSRLIYYRENILEAIESMEDPYLVGFSNYVWNYAYNKAFATELKRKHPSCIVVFGGHQIPDNTSLLLECEYIDFLIHGDGEIPFRDLLLALCGKGDFSKVSNLSYRIDDGCVKNESVKINGVVNYPSPYIAGVFDPLISKQCVKFIALIETNRGCPYNCSFCDSIRGKKKELIIIPSKRVFEELEWIAENKIEYCLCIDSNFGICERDEQIVDYAINTNKNTGYPYIFNTAFAKEKDMSVFRMVKKLYAAGMLKESTLSFQSMSPEVQRNIHRKNMDIQSFSKVMKLYNEAGIYPYTELILGLPGETYESFKNGFDTLIEAGQVYYVEVFRCDMLINSPMAAPEYIQKYGIKTVSSPSSLHHNKPVSHQEPSGYSQIVVSTNTMNKDMWVKSNLFAAYIQSLYYMGLLRFVSTYLYYEKNIRHSDFYEALITWSEKHPETLSGAIYKTFNNIFSTFLDGNQTMTYCNPAFGEITWFAEEGIFLEIAYRIDDFFREIEEFLIQYDIQKDILGNLLLYQKRIICVPGEKQFCFDLEYDVHNYFSDILEGNYQPLNINKNTVQVAVNESYDNWIEYSKKVVWFGRKMGKTYFSNRNGVIMIEYR